MLLMSSRPRAGAGDRHRAGEDEGADPAEEEAGRQEQERQEGEPEARLAQAAEVDRLSRNTLHTSARPRGGPRPAPIASFTPFSCGSEPIQLRISVYQWEGSAARSARRNGSARQEGE